MQFDNPENPQILEDFIRAHGRQSRSIYAHRNECCGGYMTVENKPLRRKAGAQDRRRCCRAKGAELSHHGMSSVHV